MPLLLSNNYNSKLWFSLIFIYLFIVFIFLSLRNISASNSYRSKYLDEL